MSEQTTPVQDRLSEAQVAQYQRDGFVVVSGLLTPDVAREWKEVLKARLAEEGKLGEPSGVRVWMANVMDPFTAARVQDAKIVAILQQLIGPNVEYLSVKAVFKNAQTNFNSPWHQDWYYWQGSPKISIWIALDDATPDNGCLRMVPGSHREHVAMEVVDDGHGFNRRTSDEALQGRTIETVPVRRGDGIFFHDLTLHDSCPNRNGQERWTAIATYRDASQPDSSTVWQTALILSGHSVNV
jgi:hypothetical protein